MCVCVRDSAFPFSHFIRFILFMYRFFLRFCFVFMSVFVANNNQQYASFSSGVNCFLFVLTPLTLVQCLYWIVYVRIYLAQFHRFLGPFVIAVYMLCVGWAFVGGGTQEFSAFYCVCHTVVSPPLFHCRISFDDPHQAKCCGFFFLFSIAPSILVAHIFACTLFSSYLNIRNHLGLSFWLHSCHANESVKITRLFIRWYDSVVIFLCLLHLTFLVHFTSSSDNPILIELIGIFCGKSTPLKNFSVSVFDSAHFQMCFFQPKIGPDFYTCYFYRNWFSFRLQSNCACTIPTYLFRFSYICIFHSILFNSISFISTTHSIRQFLRARVY